MSRVGIQRPNANAATRDNKSPSANAASVPTSSKRERRRYPGTKMSERRYNGQQISKRERRYPGTKMSERHAATMDNKSPSANGARYDSQGQARSEASASPLVTNTLKG